MTTPTTAAMIPAAEHATGFVAVAVRFPADPAAHRITRLYHQADGTLSGMPVQLDAAKSGWTEIRPACRPDSDTAERLYELSIPTALARGALACGRPECFGGERSC
jgi:hypothetical protein